MNDRGILEYLLKVENDAEVYYQNLAARAPTKEAQRIFSLRANDAILRRAVIKCRAFAVEPQQ